MGPPTRGSDPGEHAATGGGEPQTTGDTDGAAALRQQHDNRRAAAPLDVMDVAAVDRCHRHQDLLKKFVATIETFFAVRNIGQKRAVPMVGALND